MSWDILIQDFPDVRSVDDIPDDFAPEPLGPRSEIIARVTTALPAADFTDPAWGLVEGAGWSIELNLGSDDLCQSVMLHVRGGGDAVPAVATVIDSLGARGIDMQTSEFFDVAAAQASFAEWQAYRDQVLDENPPSDPSLPKRGFFSRLFG